MPELTYMPHDFPKTVVRIVLAPGAQLIVLL